MSPKEIRKHYLSLLFSACILFTLHANNVFADDFELAEIDAPGSTSQYFIIDTDDQAGAGEFVTLQFGDAIAETLRWDVDNTRFVFSDDLRIEGNNSVIGQLYVAADHAAADSDGALNLGINSSSFESFKWTDSQDSFELTDDLDINNNQLIEGRIENRSTAPTCNSTVKGLVYHNTTDTNSYVCNGTSFEQINPSGGGGSSGWTDDGGTVRLTTSTDTVGIGTSSTEAQFHVESTDPDVYLKGSSGADYAAVIRLAGENEDNWKGGYIQYDGSGNNQLIIGVHDAADKLTSSDIESIIIARSTGNVGIANATPDQKLDVTGTVEMTGFKLPTGASNGHVLTSDANGVGTWQAASGGGPSTGSNPPQSCSASYVGDLFVDTDSGMMYLCDTSNSRNKWLSAQDLVIFGDESSGCDDGNNVNNDDGCTVDWGNGLGPETNTDLGFFIPHPMTITGYGFSNDSDDCTSGSFDLEVWSTGSSSNDSSYSFEANVATGLNDDTHNSNSLNINIDGNQYIIWGIDNNCGQSIDDWNMILYYRWRHD